MSGPSTATVKRLFALSSNCCAFPRCETTLVDSGSGKVTGRICHIQGRRGPRHNAQQSDEELHGYENLLLLCPVHHDIIDADLQEYTVERLVEMKHNHEMQATEQTDLSDDLAEGFIANVSNASKSGMILSSVHQSGGQFAETITNIALGGASDVSSSSNREKLDSRRSDAIAEVWHCTVAALDATLAATVNLGPVQDRARRQSNDVLSGTPFPELAEGAELEGWAQAQNEYLHIMAFPHFGHTATSAIDELCGGVARWRLFLPAQVSQAATGLAAHMRKLVAITGSAKASMPEWRIVMESTQLLEQGVLNFEGLLKRHLAVD